MSREILGDEIRTIPISTLTTTVSVPAAMSEEFEDGYDVPVVVQVGRVAMRVALAVSSGRELVIPAWLKEAVESAGRKTGNSDVRFMFSARRIWLSPGHQAQARNALRDTTATDAVGWDNLTVQTRQAVALRWILANVDLSSPEVGQVFESFGIGNRATGRRRATAHSMSQ